ncbi:hypothetical protein L9F63_011229, partial [Diploptera punctata]
IVVQDGSQDPIVSTKQSWLRNKYLWIGFIITIVLCSSIAAAVELVNFFRSSGPPVAELHSVGLEVCTNERYRHVPEGSDMVRWEARIMAEAEKTRIAWYGPGCKEIKKTNIPSKYKVTTKQDRHGRVTTELVIHNVTKQDAGRYKLWTYTDGDKESWTYFSLTVGDEVPLQKNNVVFCYVAQWAHERVGVASFNIEDIDPMQCTHLIYAFAHLNTTTNTVYSTNPSFDLDTNNTRGGFRKMIDLKKKYPHIKVLLGVGGWHERDYNNYSIMAETPVRRWEFIKSVTKYLKEYDFDGLDMHWQYPSEQHGVPADRLNFVFLLKELREEFDKQKRGWILVTPLGVLPVTIKRSYIIPEISKYLHYMLALCYAYHGYWEGHTGPNAPLYGVDENDELNINSSINTLLNLGAPPEKLVLGLPMYGRNFLLLNPAENDRFGGLTAGHGFQGRYVKEQDTWGYNEICLDLRKGNIWNEYWDNISHTPYISSGERFMSYDNLESMKEKLEFAIDKKLAGVSVWSLDQDDFLGNCAPDGADENEHRYPMMKTINQMLFTTSYGPKSPCVNRKP